MNKQALSRAGWLGRPSWSPAPCGHTRSLAFPRGPLPSGWSWALMDMQEYRCWPQFVFFRWWRPGHPALGLCTRQSPEPEEGSDQEGHHLAWGAHSQIQGFRIEGAAEATHRPHPTDHSPQAWVSSGCSPSLWAARPLSWAGIPAPTTWQPFQVCFLTEKMGVQAAGSAQVHAGCPSPSLTPSGDGVGLPGCWVPFLEAGPQEAEILKADGLPASTNACADPGRGSGMAGRAPNSFVSGRQLVTQATAACGREGAPRLLRSIGSGGLGGGGGNWGAAGLSSSPSLSPAPSKPANGRADFHVTTTESLGLNRLLSLLCSLPPDPEKPR